MSTEMTMTLHSEARVAPSELRLEAARGNAVRIESTVADRANGTLTLRGQGLYDWDAKTQVSLNGLLLRVLRLDARGEWIVAALPALAPPVAFVIVQSGRRVGTVTAVLDSAVPASAKG